MTNLNDLDCYLVGGAVRDRLLGLPVKDRDWVVVGATPDDMLARGFKQVGNDFPVFLHPHSGEEYALARIERKTGQGHGAFAFDTSASVTLEEDLSRRDLTINAIAEREDGTLVDPYGGVADIKARVLRHVSDALIEDPLRVLRVARFAARFADLQFTIDVDTMRIMSEMAAGDELNTLSVERVWSETERALLSDTPVQYFRVLRACGALARLFPEIEALFGVPQPAQWHPEIDTGVHTFMVLEQATVLSASPEVRFAALVHDLGKAVTPVEQWPSHRGHEAAGAELVDALCERLRAPKRYWQLARNVAAYHLHCHRALELKPKSVVKLFERLGAFRDVQRLQDFLIACEADARGRTGLEQRPYPQRQYLLDAFAAAAAIDNARIAAEGHTGAAFGNALHAARLHAVAAVKAQLPDSASE
ncbi:MAG: multifunctional CCA addition/repair protein [Pseudomonadota bacterium]